MSGRGARVSTWTRQEFPDGRSASPCTKSQRVHTPMSTAWSTERRSASMLGMLGIWTDMVARACAPPARSPASGETNEHFCFGEERLRHLLQHKVEFGQNRLCLPRSIRDKTTRRNISRQDEGHRHFPLQTQAFGQRRRPSRSSRGSSGRDPF